MQNAPTNALTHLVDWFWDPVAFLEAIAQLGRSKLQTNGWSITVSETWLHPEWLPVLIVRSSTEKWQSLNRFSTTVKVTDGGRSERISEGN